MLEEAEDTNKIEEVGKTDSNSPVTISNLQQTNNNSITNDNEDDQCKQLNSGQTFADVATICIKETETQMEENVTGVGGNFVVYLVETRPVGKSSKIAYSSVWRRFSEFDMLRDYFVATYKHVIIPVIEGFNKKTRKLNEKFIICPFSFLPCSLQSVL